MVSFAAIARIAMVVLILTCANGARAQILVGTSQGVLAFLNPTNGSLQQVVNTGNAFLTGLGSAPDGTIYLTDVDATGSSSNLYKITLDRTTPANTTVSFVANLGQVAISGLASSGGKFYGLVEGTSSNAQLVAIDPSTYAVTVQNSDLGFFSNGGLTSDPKGGRPLYAVQGDVLTAAPSTPSGLYQINPTATTGSTLVKSDPGFSKSGAAAVYAIANYQSTLYAFNDSGGIFTIDSTTGVATSTGTYNTATFGSIFAAVSADAPALPEAGSGTLAATGLGIMVLWVGIARRRRTRSALEGSKRRA